MDEVVAGDADAAARWLSAAAAVLRRGGRDVPAEQVAQALAERTGEGIPVPVLGGAVPPGPRRPAPGWDLRALVADDDVARAGADLAAELAGGADSVWLVVGGPGTDPDGLAALAADIPETVPLVLEPDGDLDETALARVLAGRAPGTTLGADPLSRRVRGRSHDRDIVDTARTALDFGVGAVVVDGTAAHEAGAGDTGELGYALAVATHYLRRWTRAGLAADTAADLLSFRFAVTDEQFAAIAKLRAAQRLWSRVRQLCDLEPARVPVHAVTSRLMLTRYDPWTNLLRTTVAGFAAAVGGADAVTVLPHDAAAGHSDPTARRLARAVLLVCRHESRLDRDDPAAGAGALEELTEAFAEAAWREFRRLERAGVEAAVADGSLTRDWQAADAERRARIADGRARLTGITAFPHPEGRPPERAPRRADDRFATVRRWAGDVEKIWEEA